MSTHQAKYALRLVGGIAMLFAVGCARATQGQPTSQATSSADSGATRVLFIGNSYLYHRDIPGIVEALADSAGGVTLRTRMLARPDFALVDHWMGRSVRREIERGRYDVVVLQQGPSSTLVNRDSLRLLTRMYSELIARSGGRTALFAAWPSQQRWFDFERAIESYRLAAADVGGLFLPVAPAWVETRERRRNTTLYSDNLHPTTTGAYLSALVVYATLLDRSPLGLPSRVKIRGGPVVSIDPEVAAFLQEIAADVVRREAAP